MAGQTFLVDAAFMKSIADMATDLHACRQWQKNFKVEGGNFSNTPGGPTLTINAATLAKAGVINPEFNAICGEALREPLGEDADPDDPQNYRWFYSWQSAEIAEQGLDGFQAKTNAMSGENDDPDTRAINLAEVVNGASGVMGNGADTTQFPTDPDAEEGDPPILYLVPIVAGTPIRMRRDTTKDGKVQFVIVAAGVMNGIQGRCATGGA